MIYERELANIYNDHAGKLYRHLRAWQPKYSREDAEDVVQESFLRVANSGREPTRALVYKTAENVVKDINKSAEWMAEKVELHPAVAFAPEADEADSTANVREIRECINLLSEDDRQIMLLDLGLEGPVLKNNTAQEVAEAFGVPYGTARMRMCRSRKRMREIMEEGS